MDEITAYCGLACTNCPAYIATQAGDEAALERVVAQWRQEFNAPDMTLDSAWCDGCPGTEGRKMGHWAECEMRACAMGRDLANCAYCPEYACETLQGFLNFVPEARARLEGIRAGLAA